VTPENRSPVNFRHPTEHGWKTVKKKTINLINTLTVILIASLVFENSDFLSATAQDARVSIEPRAVRPPAGGLQERDPNFQTNASLVLVPVLVTDNQDRMVTGLDKNHFRVYEDKVEQTITQFASDDVPISVGLVFDCSGSMGSKLEKSRLAVKEFFKIANPEDEFSLVEFNNTVRPLADFTSAPEEIQSQLLFTQSKGTTALLDAIYLAVQKMKFAHRARKAILVISDGGDNASRYTERDIKNLVREADVQVYAIGIVEPAANLSRTPEELAGPALLDDLARQSGGKLFQVQDPNELPAVAAKIGMALRNQYVLGYAPATGRKDGKYHRIQVKLAKGTGLSSLRASFRSGYYAPTE
jgi:Ca-activated chloride channel homolog